MYRSLSVNSKRMQCWYMLIIYKLQYYNAQVKCNCVFILMDGSENGYASINSLKLGNYCSCKTYIFVYYLTLSSFK